MVSNKIPKKRIDGLEEALELKQNKLTAGDNVSISDDTISVSLDSKQDKLTAGTNVSIQDGVISVDLDSKQDKLTAGKNITIDSTTNTISATISAEELDVSTDGVTIHTTADGKLEVFGLRTRNDQLMHNWIGTEAEWTAGKADGTIQDSWVCYVTDDAPEGNVSLAGTNNFYTKSEIDTKLGSIETILDSINGEVI